MGVRVLDAKVYIAPDDTENTTSTDDHVLLIEGDTIRLKGNKTPSGSSDSGYSGEICHDNDYIYVYTSGGWKRSLLSTF